MDDHVSPDCIEGNSADRVENGGSGSFQQFIPSGAGQCPGLRSAVILYAIVFVLLFFFGSLLQGWNMGIGMIATQWLIILPPALIYWRRCRVEPLQFARLRPLAGRFIPAIVLLALSFWVLNLIFAAGLIGFMSGLGYEPVVAIAPPRSPEQYLLYIAALVISAGICEEVLFRGTIMPAMESHGPVPAVVFSSLLFALFHGSFTSLAATFTLGMVIAVVVIKSGSLWGGILFHMLNNFFAATMLYGAGMAETVAEPGSVGAAALLPLAVPALAGAYFGLRLLQKKSGVEPLFARRGRNMLPRGWFSPAFAVALLLFLLLAFLELAVGFGWLGELAGAVSGP